MPKYKPMLVYFDEEGFQDAQRKADDKLELFDKALKWCGQYIKVDAPESFIESFTEYFKDQFFQKNIGKIQLDISVERLLYLMEIEIAPLQDIELQFKENATPLFIRDGKPVCAVDKDRFKRFTKSAEENKMLKAGNNFIDALNEIKEYTHIYPMTISQGTSGMLRFDMRRNKLLVDFNRITKRA